MHVLTVNAGSTSLKLERYELGAGHNAVATPPPALLSTQVGPGDVDALSACLEAPLDAVAHRFVRVPDDAPGVYRIDAGATAALAVAGADAPLQNDSALRAVENIRRLRPEVPQFAVSDSAFHRTMPDAATTYALPRELTRSGFRRRGYHGLSHEYAAHRACALVRRDVGQSRVVTAHVGGGSSLCAVRNGESLDTTMGYTPLEGLPMATRSGSVDPGLLLHLLRGGMTADALEDTLLRRSGLLGISGSSGDVRDLLALPDDPAAQLALAVLAWRLRASLGAMIAVLGGVDLVAFTGGIGENAPSVRAAAIEGGLGVGAALDFERNARATEGRIEAAPSTVPVCVVAAREGWQLARAVAAVS